VVLGSKVGTVASNTQVQAFLGDRREGGLSISNKGKRLSTGKEKKEAENKKEFRCKRVTSRGLSGMSGVSHKQFEGGKANHKTTCPINLHLDIDINNNHK